MNKYLYLYKHDYHHGELCQLEVRQLHDGTIKERYVLSNKKIDASLSAFTKQRIDLRLSSSSFEDLLDQIKEAQIYINDFKAEYTVLEGDATAYNDRLSMLREVGFCINGEPDFKKPKTIFTIGKLTNQWFFGEVKKHNPSWQIHKLKPCSFSNSLDMHLAKTLVNLATKGEEKVKILDACCGVGTVLLEACKSGVEIEGCDINWSAYRHTLDNLEHYGYSAKVYNKDIQELKDKYDAVIIDLPYNLYAASSEEVANHIISSSAKLSNRLIIVSITNIRSLLLETKLNLVDRCGVQKPGKGSFKRYIWVCEK